MGPETVICRYNVRKSDEGTFVELLTRHWPTLSRLKLVTNAPVQHFRGEDPAGAFFVEIFEWADANAVGVAHEHPEVAAIWEKMGTLTEDRNGQPAMEFPHVQPLRLIP